MIESTHALLPADLEVLVWQDLADLRDRHAAALEFFQKYHRDAFDAYQRIVLYSSHEPEQAFLDHIQYFAAKVDISNFFILFLSPFDLTIPLIHANQKHGSDNNRMQSLIVSLPDTKPFGTARWADRTYLCALPFMKLDINTKGLAKPCCKFKGQVGDLGQKTITEIFYDAPLEAVRTSMLSGKQWAGCSNCWTLEQQGITSYRQLFMSKYQEQMDQTFIDRPALIDLTISPYTLCNFKCRICDENSSSQIQTENIMHTIDSKQADQLRQRYREFSIRQEHIDWEWILQQLDSIEYLHIMGGEPLLSPKIKALIDRLATTAQAHKINLELNTNGSIYIQELTTWARYFKSVTILISIDDIGPRFEIQRGGSWSEVEDNIKKFVDAKKFGVNVQLSPTVNLQNILYLDALVVLAKNLDLNIVWSYLEYPQALSIERPTLALKKLVCERYIDHPEAELRSIAEKMRNTAPVDGKQFLAFIQQLDKRRSQDFCSHHPELCETMM